jgi:hypothetical protein
MVGSYEKGWNNYKDKLLNGYFKKWVGDSCKDKK